MPSLTEKRLHSWEEFSRFISSRKGEWIYRGQTNDWDLSTSLERAIDAWDVNPSYAPKIEHHLIREFQRRYRGDAERHVNNDTLYCLGVMQHHGAPTRLLDWTYSPFVAAKFAIEKGRKKRSPVIWCINNAWCDKAARKIKTALNKRSDDKRRTDETFWSAYLEPKSRKKFVHPANPFFLNERLTIQQGVFLCPGDITVSFLDNLKSMNGWKLASNVVKLHLEMDKQKMREFADFVKKMNISSAALFPGLDGVARSLGEHIFFYEDFVKRKVGE